MATSEMVRTAWEAYWKAGIATEQEKWAQAIDAVLSMRKPAPGEATGILKIEINFTCPVDLTREIQIVLDRIAGEICDQYVRDHPGRTMWPAGVGFKPTFIPMTLEQEKERGMEFDETTFEIECFEREDYDFRCLKCGRPQGDHGHCIVDPPAGDCEFVSTQ